MKQINEIKLAASLSPITKKSDTINETTKQLVKKSDVDDGNTQTPTIENTSVFRSLLDTLAFMKKIKKIFILVEEDGGKVNWNDVFFKPPKENRISI